MNFIDHLLMLAAIGAAVAGLAAGAAGLSYLIRSGIWGFRAIARVARGLARLASVGSVDDWPNGSHDLPTFLRDLYCTVQKLLRYHEAELWEVEAGLRSRTAPGDPDLSRRISPTNPQEAGA